MKEKHQGNTGLLIALLWVFLVVTIIMTWPFIVTLWSVIIEVLIAIGVLLVVVYTLHKCFRRMS